MEIIETKDYEKFTLHPMNREIREQHVQDFVELLPISNLLPICPIVVDGQYQIIDGQHRFLACKQLGIPFHYTVKKDATDDDIVSFNSVAIPWKIIDYIKYFAKKGLEPYILTLKVMERYKLTDSTAIKLVRGMASEKERKILKEGKLKAVYSMEQIDKVMDYVVRTRDWIKSKLPLVERAFINERRFIEALINFYSIEELDKEKFFEKICRQVTRIHRCHSIAEYERLFAQIYNLHSRQPLDFKMSELKGFDYE